MRMWPRPAASPAAARMERRRATAPSPPTRHRGSWGFSLQAEIAGWCVSPLIRPSSLATETEPAAWQTRLQAGLSTSDSSDSKFYRDAYPALAALAPPAHDGRMKYTAAAPGLIMLLIVNGGTAKDAEGLAKLLVRNGIVVEGRKFIEFFDGQASLLWYARRFLPAPRGTRAASRGSSW